MSSPSTFKKSKCHFQTTDWCLLGILTTWLKVNPGRRCNWAIIKPRLGAYIEVPLPTPSRTRSFLGQLCSSIGCHFPTKKKIHIWYLYDHPPKIQIWPCLRKKHTLNTSKLLPRISETFCLGAGVSGASSLVPDSSSPWNVTDVKGCQGHRHK